jgi:ubiquinone/menaquinone biosynthesis C-methylase UbiE
MAGDVSPVTGLDHVQLAMPRGSEERARAFYGGVLGMPEVPKPAALAARGGVWFRCGPQMLHLGVADEFRPQRKAHPALLVSDLAAVRARLQALGAEVVEDNLLPGFERFYTEDPFGNRLECLWPKAVGDESAEATKALVRQIFSKSAESYVTSPSHAAGPDLHLLLEWAAPTADDYALDVSTGGGHTALALAPQVGRVIASDLTPRMLVAARNFLTSQGVSNADFVLADAEHLPFLDETFSLVTVRIAPHHYVDAPAAVREMARVLTPGGRLVLVDNIAPEDPELDAAINEWERRRDPSHVRDYSVTEWLTFLGQAGLRVTQSEVLRRAHEFQPWVKRSQMPEVAAAELERDLLRAPERVRRYFAVEERAGRLIGFTADYLVLRAVR